MTSSSQNTFEGSIDDIFDQYFDQHFDQTFENFSIQYGGQEDERKERKKNEFISKEIEKPVIYVFGMIISVKLQRILKIFRRRFRMDKLLFMHIVDRLSNGVQFFLQKKDGLGRLGLSRLQKCTTTIRVLAYGIINLFGDEYLRRPTPADLQRLLDIGEHRGFPGMIGNIDCMHWEWKNCPTAWKEQYSRGSGTLNYINVLDRSPVLDDIIKGQAPQVTYSVNGREYHMAYYLTDGPKAVLFAQRQEVVRKDAEHVFGVLQARFAIVKNPTLFWDKVKIEKIMRACIILYNMIVEDERDEYTQFDVSEFQQGEDTGSSHVDLDFSTDMHTNIANMMGVRTRICDRQMHLQLKTDLVKYIWRKFGRDEDNN
uniref:DDE Tnp4 domain-containing protein n=1 Tax=Brassica oleracea var. oleracea TaxID=109376 RepID=A0A0D3DMU5_BRAOL